MGLQGNTKNDYIFHCSCVIVIIRKKEIGVELFRLRAPKNFSFWVVAQSSGDYRESRTRGRNASGFIETGFLFLAGFFR